MITKAAAREIAKLAIQAYLYFESETDTEHAEDFALESFDDDLARADIDEMARLHTERRGLHDTLAQQRNEVDAERAARRAAEADNAAWITFVGEAARQLEHGARCEEIQSDLFEAWHRAISGNAPGQALQSELAAARAVVWAAREADFTTVALGLALRNYDKATKARGE